MTLVILLRPQSCLKSAAGSEGRQAWTSAVGARLPTLGSCDPWSPVCVCVLCACVRACVFVFVPARGIGPARCPLRDELPLTPPLRCPTPPHTRTPAHPLPLPLPIPPPSFLHPRMPRHRCIHHPPTRGTHAVRYLYTPEAGAEPHTRLTATRMICLCVAP